MSASRNLKSIHVLVAHQGDYEDYRMRVVSAFASGDRARWTAVQAKTEETEFRKRVREALAKLDGLSDDDDRWSREFDKFERLKKRLTRQCAYDLDIDLSDDTTYGVLEIPFNRRGT